jgi:hypothetical protein
MQLAGPQKPADQVAALVGVTPAAIDRGEPVRLALNKGDTMLADAAPVAKPTRAAAAPKRVAVATAPVAAPAPVAVAAAPVAAPAPIAVAAAPVAVSAPQPEAPAPKFVEAVSAPPVAPQPTPAVAPAPQAAPKPTLTPVIAEASLPLPVAMLAAVAHEMPTLVRAIAPHKAPAPVRHAQARRVVRPSVGPGDAIVQLGAYSSPKNVDAAWNILTKRHPALHHYLPLRARFVSAKGTFWRLSIQGFANQHDAVARCNLLKSNGGKCFVRGFAGDAPVQIAMN